MDVALADVLTTVRQFVEKKQGAAARPIDAETPLLREGHVDSFGLVELIADLQQQLHITIADGDLIPEDFETPRTLYERLEAI